MFSMASIEGQFPTASLQRVCDRWADGMLFRCHLVMWLTSPQENWRRPSDLRVTVSHRLFTALLWWVLRLRSKGTLQPAVCLLGPWQPRAWTAANVDYPGLTPLNIFISPLRHPGPSLDSELCSVGLGALNKIRFLWGFIFPICKRSTMVIQSLWFGQKLCLSVFN